MKIRIKICAAITALTIFCAALLTACGGAPRPTFLYENPTDGVTEAIIPSHCNGLPVTEIADADLRTAAG